MSSIRGMMSDKGGRSWSTALTINASFRSTDQQLHNTDSQKASYNPSRFTLTGVHLNDDNIHSFIRKTKSQNRRNNFPIKTASGFVLNIQFLSYGTL